MVKKCISFLTFVLLVFLVFDKPAVFGQSFTKYPVVSLPEYIKPQFLRPNDPVSVALGLTGTAYRTGASAPLSNPAGLAELDRLELSFSHIPSYNIFGLDLYNQEAVAVGLPLPAGFALGFHFFYLNFGEVDTWSPFNPVNKKERAGIRQFQFTAAKKFSISETVIFSFGSNIKHINFYIGPPFMKKWLVDLGSRIKWKFDKSRFSMGISVTNIGSDIEEKYISMDGETHTFKEPIARFLRLGLAWGTVGAGISKQGANPQFMVTVEYQHDLYKNNKEFSYAHWKFLGCGLEGHFFNHLHGEIGYHFDLRTKNKYENYKGFTYGFGFETPRSIFPSFPLRLQLSYGKGAKQGLINQNVIAVTLVYQR